MTLFEKGNFAAVDEKFRFEGLEVLQGITRFQIAYDSPDTDTAVNQIRDAIISHYLGFELLNTAKHGFDARKIDREEYLEIKQCSLSSGRLGGVWNDTSEDKARLFSDPRVFTAIAVWKNAADLQFIVYGQHEALGKYLLDKVQNRKEGSRSTQSVSIVDLIVKYGFAVVCPPNKDKAGLLQYLGKYNKRLAETIQFSSIKNVSDYS